MNRRNFLAGSLALALPGCRVLTLEQGLMSECRPANSPEARHPLVEASWEGIRPERFWDAHVHLFGNGRGGSGLWVDPDLDRPRSPQALARHAFFRNAACTGDDDARLDEALVQRLTEVADAMPPGAKVMLLAFDFTYDERGRRQEDLTTFAVPDAYARRVAASRPERFEWIASVHPYREDALEALEAAARAGARAVKWLPPTMAIDPRHPRCRPYYEALRRLDLPLLMHVGAEVAAAGAHRVELANPLLMRSPLNEGVRVVAAHCATLGESADLDANASAAKAPMVDNFALFQRLMSERRYEGLLFGEISAVTQVNRAHHIPAILEAPWEGRLLNGSDYPLPGILPIFSINRFVSAGLLDEKVAAALRPLRHVNPLLFDFALKRHLASRGRRFAPAVFETSPFFSRVRIGRFNQP